MLNLIYVLVKKLTFFLRGYMTTHPNFDNLQYILSEIQCFDSAIQYARGYHYFFNKLENELIDSMKDAHKRYVMVYEDAAKKQINYCRETHPNLTIADELVVEVLKVASDFSPEPNNQYNNFFKMLDYGFTKAAWLEDSLTDGYKAIDYINQAQVASTKAEKESFIKLSHHENNSSIDKSEQFLELYPTAGFLDAEIIAAAREFRINFEEASAIGKAISVEIGGVVITDYQEA
jgi:hypothetical protein